LRKKAEVNLLMASFIDCHFTGRYRYPPGDLNRQFVQKGILQSHDYATENSFDKKKKTARS
jgi:hypothetical protein